MTEAALIRQIAKRGLSINVREDGALVVKPRAAMDDSIRAAIREHRLSIVARLTDGASFLSEVCETFDAAPLPDAFDELHEGHTDGVQRLCVLDYHEHRCEAFTEAQFAGYSASRLAKVCRDEKRGCGLCVNAITRWRVSKIEAENNRRDQKRKAEERSRRMYLSD